MSEARYCNHQHYLVEGWSAEPKESFKLLHAILKRESGLDDLDLLDIGCATGELLGYLTRVTRSWRLVGVDVSEDLLREARRFVPSADFRHASVLDLPTALSGRFDVVCAMGCMSIFDETTIERFWDNLLGAAKPSGLVVVFSPLNEYGVDVMIRHRKRQGAEIGEWETGWNIFSIATIEELLIARGASLRLERFDLLVDLAPKPDPVRTWTMRTETRARQLTNGLKLLVDHYFMIVERRKA
jgi:SAM-dependent methyltransferase